MSDKAAEVTAVEVTPEGGADPLRFGPDVLRPSRAGVAAPS